MQTENDCVAGLQRFLYCHFPPVCNKIVPENLDEAESKALMESGEYFNNVF